MRRRAAPFPVVPNGDSVVVRLRLIGQMEAWTLTSESVLPVGRKTRALLAILATAAPRPVLRSRLAEMLWSKRPEEQARASLRQEIHRLLHTLGPDVQHALVVNRDHLALRPGSAWVDVDEVMRATPGKPGPLSLLDGDLLEDLDGLDPAFDAWLAAERERLRDKARSLVEAMLRDQTEPDMAILAARQLLGIDRTHEGAWRALMRAHAMRGERGMAIQAFDRCRASLAELTAAEPSEETQRLVAEIRASGAVRSSPTAASAPVPRGDARTSANTEPKADPRAETVGDRRVETVAPTAVRVPRTGPRIGVLPLQMIGGAELEAHLGIGLAEEITAGLARCRWMHLVSCSAMARFAGAARDESAIRRTFDIQFLLDGSVQRVQGTLRVSLRMLDMRAGNQVVWSRRFDRDATDLLAAQDDIVAEAVAQIDPELLVIEQQRMVARPTSEPPAYELQLRALALMDRMDRKLFAKAGDLLRQAIATDPDFASAHSSYAAWHLLLASQDWAADFPGDLAASAGRAAERAMMLDPQDGKALAIAGHIRAVLHRRPPEAVALHDRALALNPNLAMAWALSGVAHAFLGDLAEGQRRLQRYKKLAPLHPQSFIYDTGLATVALLRGDYAEAACVGRGASESNPAFSGACKPYLSALGYLGQHDEAAAIRARLLTLEPAFSVSRFTMGFPFEQAAHREHYAEGLRRAGLPA